MTRRITEISYIARRGKIDIRIEILVVIVLGTFRHFGTICAFWKFSDIAKLVFRPAFINTPGGNS
jgi:hypothetical protein